MIVRERRPTTSRHGLALQARRALQSSDQRVAGNLPDCRSRQQRRHVPRACCWCGTRVLLICTMRGPREQGYNGRMAGEMRIPGWATYVALAVLDGALLNFGRQEHCCQEAVVVSCVRYKMAAWAWGVLDAANARSIVARARAPAARRRCAHGKGPWKRAGAWAAGSGAERVPLSGRGHNFGGSLVLKFFFQIRKELIIFVHCYAGVDSAQRFIQ